MPNGERFVVRWFGGGCLNPDRVISQDPCLTSLASMSSTRIMTPYATEIAVLFSLTDWAINKREHKTGMTDH